jgi:DNA polymerase III delta subunit
LKPRESIHAILEKYAKTLTKPTKSKTSKLIDEILIANNSTFANEDARDYFFKTVGDETFSLENEAIKLANYTPKITKDDIDALVMKFDEQNLFELVELIVAKDIAASIKLVDRLILSKYGVIDIINIIAGQLFALKLILMGTDNAFQISKQLNIPI